MFKILIDSTPIREQKSGVGFYAHNLIEALANIKTPENFSFGIYRQPSLSNWLRGKKEFPDSLSKYARAYHLPLPVTVTHLLAKYANFSLTNFDSYLEKPDLIHGTDHFVYPCKKAKKIMTIHDLTFMKYPRYSNAIVKTYTARIKQCLQWTDLVITFSLSSQQDIIDYLGVKPEKIYITSEASRYFPNYLTSPQIETLKSNINYDFSQPYLLSVSTLEPRKNIVNLIRAFNLLKKKQDIPHHLILIGQKGWAYQDIFAAINQSNFQDDIHHLGYLADELVALFYSLADVFVYPSFYEGFGLPVLEAMTLGAPVVAANASSLPEVAGDAAILVNPHDYNAIAAGIYQIIDSRELRAQLIAKGKRRAKLFSWENTAQETINAYRKVLSQSS